MLSHVAEKHTRYYSIGVIVIWSLYEGSCIDVLKTLPENSIDAVVTDPPYELGLKNLKWDKSGIAHNPGLWREVLKVLKPGGHLLAFGGSRTYHRLANAVEEAGFEIRDCLQWLYGTGMPKGVNVAKALNKTRPEIANNWKGWSTNLKPAHEPIILARKPLDGSVAENVTKWGCGALNIDACRVGKTGGVKIVDFDKGKPKNYFGKSLLNGKKVKLDKGRWPTNVMLDQKALRMLKVQRESATRFFYVPKPSKQEKGEYNDHDTVKPLELMKYLCRLITPLGGTVLDPFAGSGTTLLAARLEGFSAIGIELEAKHCEIIHQRMAEVD